MYAANGCSSEFPGRVCNPLLQGAPQSAPICRGKRWPLSGHVVQAPIRPVPLWLDLAIVLLVAVLSGCGSYLLFKRTADVILEPCRAKTFAVSRLEKVGKADYELIFSDSFPKQTYRFSFQKGDCSYSILVSKKRGDWGVEREDERAATKEDDGQRTRNQHRS